MAGKKPSRRTILAALAAAIAGLFLKSRSAEASLPPTKEPALPPVSEDEVKCYSYDPVELSFQDRLSKVTIYTYDAHGRCTMIQDGRADINWHV